MLYVSLAGDHLYEEIAVHLAEAGDVYYGVFLCCHFPTRYLAEIWNLIESVF